MTWSAWMPKWSRCISASLPQMLCHLDKIRISHYGNIKWHWRPINENRNMGFCSQPAMKELSIGLRQWCLNFFEQLHFLNQEFILDACDSLTMCICTLAEWFVAIYLYLMQAAAVSQNTSRRLEAARGLQRWFCSQKRSVAKSVNLQH